MLKHEWDKTRKTDADLANIADRELLNDLDRKLQEGLDDVKNGRVMPLDVAIQRLYDELGLKPD
jgi:hypothetical protein